MTLTGIGFAVGERTPGDGMASGFAGERLPAAHGGIDVSRVDFHAATAAAGSLCGNQTGAAADEYVEDDLPALGAIDHRVGDQRDRLDRRMQRQKISLFA